MKSSSIDILGIKTSLVNTYELVNIVKNCVKSQEKYFIPNINVHCANLAYTNPQLRKVLNNADLVHIDGYGIRLGAKLLGYNSPPRTTYADFIWDIAKMCEKEKITLFFLGAKPGVAKQAADRITKKHPQLNIVGTQHGYFNKDAQSIENEEIVEIINKSAANILIVGFGMPFQEFWLNQNWEKLNVNVALCGGAVFDYTSGQLMRGSKLMRSFGFEWLARLAIEPKRLWKRYIFGNPLFVYRILKQRFCGKSQ